MVFIVKASLQLLLRTSAAALNEKLEKAIKKAKDQTPFAELTVDDTASPEDDLQWQQEIETSNREHNQMLKFIQPGVELTGDNYRQLSKYFASGNDGEDAWVPLEVTAISNEVAQLLSEWSPHCNCSATLELSVESLSDEAAEFLSQWRGNSHGFGYLHLGSLRDISTKGANFLLKSPVGLYVSPNLLPDNIKEILMQRPVEQDDDDGYVWLEPIQ
jgi:hypothetical protein